MPAQNAPVATTALLEKICTDRTEDGATLSSCSVHRWPCSTPEIIRSLAMRPISSGYLEINHHPASALSTSSSAIHSVNERTERAAAGICSRKSVSQRDRPNLGGRLTATCSLE